MTNAQKISSLKKMAQTAYVSPQLFDVGVRSGHYLRKATAEKLDSPAHTLEEEAKAYDFRADEKLKKYYESDPYFYNILVGGANAGGRGFFGLSALPFGPLAKGENRVLFRHNQEDEIRSKIQWAIKKGLHPRVVGHSWGGAVVANMAKDFSKVPFYALDPTSWTGVIDEVPENLTIYVPKNDVEGNMAGRLAQIFGHQWPRITKGKGRTVEYSGNHVDGLGAAMAEMNDSERSKRIVANPMENKANPLENKANPLENKANPLWKLPSWYNFARIPFGIGQTQTSKNIP